MDKKINKKDNIPAHLAIIMDGNGRWASKNNKNRIIGHKKGVESVREITKASVKLKINYLTLYTFSYENWDRPKTEIIALMKLLSDTLDSELKLLLDNNIQLKIIGNQNRLDVFTRRKIKKVVDATEKNDGLILTLAISYGSRQEILNAVNKIIKNKIKPEIGIDDFKSYLYTANIPDPDLLIRTGKEYRISNFLLWQIAYSEIYFSDVYWPDFNEKELNKALLDFQSRERRYGRTSNQIK